MIRAIVVDDEPLAVQKLVNLLHATSVVEVVGTFVYPADLIAAIPSIEADVFFLDIEMPETDGLALADHVFSLVPGAQIVFVTAYDQYAIEAFELNALDYLLKPVRRERLQKTVGRITIGQKSHAKTERIKVICLGGFKVLNDTNAARNFRWRTSKAQELFAFLVHCRGQAVSRQAILDSVWSHLDGDRAVTHFHTTLYYLRKNLHDAGYDALVHHENGMYWMDIDGIECDYYETDQLMLETVDKNRRMEVSKKLLNLYKGGYLERTGWSWAEPTRHELEIRCVSFSILLYETFVEEGDIPAAIQMLQGILSVVPLNEELFEKLIHAYMLIDDIPSATKQYQVLRQRLQEEYGIDPSDSLNRLFD
ncbi:response regulator [Alicyclobacillus sp. SO9]|uniref:response regulator n=1 Tax=Alicyclobacillus sp. SO9 TaxID=2665646 RepID=UPI0018E6DC52|nr:response regulator [Alicyclobacillus sp. SO9]QQE77603.1 response regulator [Alicyclobacillus sp. SO9]